MKGGSPRLRGNAGWRKVPLDLAKAGEPLMIVGVMPEDFDFPRGTEIWVPAAPLATPSAALVSALSIIVGLEPGTASSLRCRRCLRSG